METKLNNRHRDTLKKILGHPASRNVEWRQVRSLLEATGATVDEHGSKLEVRDSAAWSHSSTGHTARMSTFRRSSTCAVS